MKNLLLLVLFMASLELGNSINDPIVFNLTQNNYSVYEDEYITICLDGPSNTELTSLAGSSLELEIVNGWSNFSRINRAIEVEVGRNCFHLKANQSNATSDLQYTAKFSSPNEDVVMPGNINITVKKRNGDGAQLEQNHLYIKGIDSSVDDDGTDKIILGNTVSITPYTAFSISSAQSTPTGSDIVASYNFMYTGSHDMNEDGIFCILINDQGYQAFGDIPDVSISFNGQDFTPFFSITNALPNPTSTSFIPSNAPNIISVNQGDYYENALNGTSFVGSTLSDVGINLNNGSLGGGNNLGPGFEFNPNGDFSAIFVCDGNLYFCDLEALFADETLWNFDEGGGGRDDFDAQTCVDFCSIIDSDCSSIGYDLNVVDCELVFNISDCSILSDSDIKWYYKPSSECGTSGGYNELVGANFTVIKDSPTSVEIALPIPYNTGCYMVEVYCDECPSPIVKEIEVDECCPFAYNITTLDATCNPTGGINLEILGVGIPPFSYEWDNGATSEDLYMVNAGTYTVTVTDSNGCKDEFSANVETCCCEYTLDFGGPGLEISDIYVNGVWLSDNPSFTFPYDNDGVTSTSADLQDLVNDLNAYEGATGNAYLQNGIIIVESCNVYEYIIGNDQYAKNDDCENTDVMTVANNCENIIDYECNLMFDLVSNGDCSLDIIISQNSNYLVTLEYRAPNTNVWTAVVSDLSYSTNIAYAATGFYRLVGVGVGICKDVVACEIQHICCECEIAYVELLGDYLEDGELCQGIDSLGFRVITQNCLNNTDVELTLPDGSTQMMVEVVDDVYEIMIATAPDENDNGLYTFNATDSYNCFDIEEMEIEVENCELCANCELLLPMSSYTPGKINIGALSTSCGVIDSFEISWYLNEVDEQNILLKTGTSDDVINHPLSNFPVQAGTIIPVLDWISINGDYYDEEYPGIGSCLDSISVDIPGCESGGYSASYNYAIGGFPDRVIDFKVSGNTNYVRVLFRGYDVNDTIKVLHNDEVLFYAAIGWDVDMSDYNSSPNKIKNEHVVPYLIDVNDIEFDADSILRIEIYANKFQTNTKWNLNIQCVDEYECGELGEPDYENISCSFDSSFCYYSFNLPHIGVIAPQNLPFKYNFRLGTTFTVSKSICSQSIDFSYLSPDYCEQDSLEIEANSTLGNYTLTFHGTGSFYSGVKAQLESLLLNSAADCEYTGDIDYYKKLIITLRSGIECFEGNGDESNTQYLWSFVIHPCIENIDFLDAEKKIIFHKTSISNYQANDCEECKAFIQSNYVYPIGIPVNENSSILNKKFYQLQIANYNFKFKSNEELANYSIRSRYIKYEAYADELCQSDSCKLQQYRLEIDDLDDGCNNFSIYVDSAPCETPTVYDSLVYQISNGIETYASNASLAEYFKNTDLTTLLEDHVVYETDARVYPNPAIHTINMEYTTNIENDINVKIYDRSLKLVREFEWDVSRGITKQTLDISAFPAGLYIIEFQEDDQSIYKRFVVVH
ncbi:MAG: T9SS type A sorting domain-containing protein [Chitinophagales bacterium]|nr:T9SS type A sorting domain-containing protein [Chitinophagales bacterium]